jgi:hypothetical protein
MLDGENAIPADIIDLWQLIAGTSAFIIMGIDYPAPSVDSAAKIQYMLGF